MYVTFRTRQANDEPATIREYQNGMIVCLYAFLSSTLNNERMNKSEDLTKTFSCFQLLKRPKTGVSVMMIVKPNLYVFRSDDLYCGVATTEPFGDGNAETLRLSSGKILYIIVKFHETRLN